MVQQQAPILAGDRTPTQVHPGLPFPMMPNMPPGIASWWNWCRSSQMGSNSDDAWRMQIQKEMEEMGLMLRAAHHENDQLRNQLRTIRESELRSYTTPEAAKESEEGEDGCPSREGHRQAEEDGYPSREGYRQEGQDGRPSREGHQQAGDDGYPSREGYRQAGEDGCPSREGHRQEEKDGPSTGVGGRQAGEDGAAARQGASGSTSSTKAQEMEFMMLMLQSVQELQRKISEDKEPKSEIEVVRAGAPDLPVLQEWTPTEGPIAMGDWLTMLEPAIADLTETAEEWWKLLMEAVQHWYVQHVAMSPLERTSHRPAAPLTGVPKALAEIGEASFEHASSSSSRSTEGRTGGRKELECLRYSGTLADPLPTWRLGGKRDDPEES